MDWESDPPKGYLRNRYNAKIDKQNHKERIRKWFEHFLSSARFIVDGYKYKFAYKTNDFAKANNIALEQAHKIFPEISKTALGKKEIVLRRFSRAVLEFKFRPSADSTTIEEFAVIKFQWEDMLTPEHPVS